MVVGIQPSHTLFRDPYTVHDILDDDLASLIDPLAVMRGDYFHENICPLSLSPASYVYFFIPTLLDRACNSSIETLSLSGENVPGTTRSLVDIILTIWSTLLCSSNCVL
mmetsp:Transcript_32953/g.80865  ORF Transcript_32953/g.80865 Transcript_32953/m.80865 type:complete len:109 (+) Transcript_32953:201-527(+)